MVDASAAFCSRCTRVFMKRSVTLCSPEIRTTRILSVGTPSCWSRMGASHRGHHRRFRQMKVYVRVPLKFQRHYTTHHSRSIFTPPPSGCERENQQRIDDWERKDSNLRRQSHQIYSLARL